MGMREELFNFCGVCGGLAYMTPTPDIVQEDPDDTLDSTPRSCDCPVEDDY